ncbi:MAG: glutamyl-tRNA reductase [Candidatus Omnitrophica bacterium]|nr:glutamyl-tRNA reductase [Candidatus Omnitrophota bacterium]
MVIQVCGMSHKTAPVEIREKLSFLASKLTGGLKAFIQYDSVLECIFLSTCNRVEIYAVKRQNSLPFEPIEFFCRFHGVEQEEISKYLYCYNDSEAIRHLFRVVTGLDSMVLGENQILGQVKRAFQSAQDAGCVGRALNEVFTEAIRTGKYVRTATEIGKGALSLGSVAIDLVKSNFSSLEGKVALVVGCGKMGELTLRHLKDSGINKVFVMNRTFDTAKDMAARTGGEAAALFEMPERMKQSDIVIVSTNAPHTIIDKELVAFAMKDRPHRPLFMIDISVPRNIDKEVKKVSNVDLYDIDDLDKLKDVNLKERLAQVGKVEDIISLRLGRLAGKLGRRKVR